jgi:hypothetical protein
MAGIGYIQGTVKRRKKKPRPAQAKTGVNYIRNATRRDTPAPVEAPKRAPIAMGIDYIRNNTKRDVADRQKAANAAARAAAAKKAKPAATAAPVSGPAGTAGGAAYEDTVALTNPQENAAMLRDPKLAGDKKKPKPGATPAAASPENPVDSLFNAAGRQLDKQERAAALQLEARLADQKAFDEYVARTRAAANTTLSEQFKASAANADKARTDSLATVQGYADAAIAAAGGNQSVLNAAGVNANMASNAATMGATAQDSAGAQQNQQMLVERQVGLEGMDYARSANMRSEAEADRRATMSEIAQRRYDLGQEKVKATIEQEAADRQYELDSVMADYVRAKGETELGLAAYNAETERLGTKTPEERAAERAMEARLNASTIAKNQAAAKKSLNDALGQGAGTNVLKDLNDWYDTELKRRGVTGVDDIGDAQSRIEIGRTAVMQLSPYKDSLTVEQAYRALRAILPPHVINDNRIKTEIARLFN